MAITVKDLLKGQTLSGKDGTLQYVITGTTDKIDAYNALVTDAGVPLKIGSFDRVDAECTVEEDGNGVWIGKAVYALPSPGNQTQNSFSISFDISGQTQKVFQSKKTQGTYAAGDNTPRDFGGAINVREDHTIEGVDILIPYLSYQVTYTYPTNQVNSTFIGNLYRTVGKINDSGFGGFLAGELLLTKVAGQRRDDKNWDVSYSFAASEEKHDVQIGTGDDMITVAIKRGWDYLWVYYQQKQVGVDPDYYIVSSPVSAYVEQVYDEANYGVLGIVGL